MQLLPVKECCELVDSTDMTIRNWIKEGKLNEYKDNKDRLLVDKRELLELYPTVISLYNERGGSNKTMSCILLADYYEKLFRQQEKNKNKILICDLDPQSSCSQIYFTYNELYGSDDDSDKYLTLYNYFENKTPLSKIIKPYNSIIDVLPADIKMSSKTGIDSFELTKLKKDFELIFKKYTLVIIDNMPSISALSRLGVLLANYVFCPLLLDDNSFRALALALTTIQDVVAYNKGFIDFRCFISSYRSHKTNIREYVFEKYQTQLKEKLLTSHVPDFVGVVERETVKENLFDKYSSDKAVEKILEFMDEIDRLIYEKRGLNG